MSNDAYEPVIGLEVHVQLGTQTKMFTRAPYRYGEAPNTLTDPVVMGMPGVLPVMNREAVARTIQVGLIFGCEIAEVCKWDRKNYWYPDSPKNYQISQYDQPLCLGGQVEIELAGPARNIQGKHKLIPLERIHLEEDVGKLTHTESDSLVDYNRAGACLIEIVTRPAIASADEAFAFLTGLRMALVNAGISACDMEKGQLRCDANISVRPVGQEKLGTKVELKNMNTISGVRAGVAYEIKRQIKLHQQGRAGEIVQETRRWNPEGQFTTAMRGKEESHDYRYFPDPDLMPVRVTKEWREELRAQLPETPFDRQRRYQKDFGLPYTITSVICPDPHLSRFFEEARALHDNPQAIANYLANDLLRELAAAGDDTGPLPLEAAKLTPAHVAGLARLIDEGKLTKQLGKKVFTRMFASGRMPEEIVAREGLATDEDAAAALQEICRQVVAGNEAVVAQIRGGNAKALNSLIGPVMKASKGKADPQAARKLLQELIGAG